MKDWSDSLEDEAKSVVVLSSFLRRFSVSAEIARLLSFFPFQYL